MSKELLQQLERLNNNLEALLKHYEPRIIEPPEQLKRLTSEELQSVIAKCNAIRAKPDQS